jgi:hypothetical protein
VVAANVGKRLSAPAPDRFVHARLSLIQGRAHELCRRSGHEQHFLLGMLLPGQIASTTGLPSPKTLAAPSAAAMTGLDMLMRNVPIQHLLWFAQRAY